MPWEVPERMRKHSPLTYADKVKTPTLILHARDDRRCPLPMGKAFHQALLARDVPTQMVIYPERRPRHPPAAPPRGRVSPRAGVVREARSIGECDYKVPRVSCSRSMASNSALKLPLPKLLRAAPLDHLEEQRRPIGDRLGEDLQHVAFVVAVDENAQLGQLVDVFLDRADALRAARRSTLFGTRRNETSFVRIARTVSMMLSVAMAMCCTPGPP